MSVPARFILQQGPVLRALARAASRGLLLRPAAGAPRLREPLRATLPVRDRRLVEAFVRHVGGDPKAYAGTLPPHLFPQWSFPLVARVLEGVPHPLVRILNAGCRLELHASLPADEPLQVSAWLQQVDDDGRRVLLHSVVETGTTTAPRALTAHLTALVPKGGARTARGPAATGRGAARQARDPQQARVPAAAREIGSWQLPADAGLDFAKLTGDFNPVHWLAPYARAFGFGGTILHGFATFARALEGIQRALFAGRVDALAELDLRFTRPLLLPARVGLYVAGAGGVWVGDAPGGPAYLTGSFVARSRNESRRARRPDGGP